MIKRKNFFKTLIYLAIFGLLCFCLSGLLDLVNPTATNAKQLSPLTPAPSQPTQPNPAISARPQTQVPFTREDVEAFFDRIVTAQLDKDNIPGAAIAMVKDGELLFTKGYGYANLERKIPVNPDTTLFRVASLSKLVTDTAAMQLYERGLLDLDADIGQYLPNLQIENPYPQPISAARLMTQTSGITRRQIGIAARTPENMAPLEEFLQEKLPPILYPPGEIYYYSNTGIALLGYLVQEISGTPFIEYIDRHILQPLGMDRSTFLQPIPPSLNGNLATGYQYSKGNNHPVPFLYLNIFPAAGLSTTATDMAQFMLAHLQGDRRILKADTVRLMQEQHFTHHPKLPGTAYGFHERLINNIGTLGHSGNLRGYSSSMTLLPDRNIGLFITVNSFTGIHEKVIKAFCDRYYPVSNLPPAPQPSQGSNLNLNRFAGVYRDLEYPLDTLAKIAAPFAHLHITSTDKNTLSINTANLFWTGQGIHREIIPVEPFLFQGIEDRDYTTFAEDEAGNIAYAFNPIGPKIGVFEKVAWFETLWFQLSLAGICAAIFLSACSIWPGVLLKKSFGNLSNYPQGKLARRGWMIAGLVSVFHLIFLIGSPLTLWSMGLWKVIYGIPPLIIAFLCLPPIAIGLTFALPVFAALNFRDKSQSVTGRSHYLLVTLAAFGFIYFLTYWNLLGFQFGG